MRKTGKNVLVYPYQCDKKLMEFEKHTWLKDIERVVPSLVNPETKTNNELYAIHIAVLHYSKHLISASLCSGICLKRASRIYFNIEMLLGNLFS